MAAKLMLDDTNLSAALLVDPLVCPPPFAV